tara:strand:+ start:2601 stop:3215 length:615 start_codon:yes stop_codon:yes gene_type:complete
MIKNIIIISILLLIILYLRKKNIYGGSGLENMPEGPAKDDALRKQKNTQKKMINSVPKSDKNVKDFAIRRRLKKYVKKFGRRFITALVLQRLYLPNPLEPLITQDIVWFPLDNDDHLAIRAYIPPFIPPQLIWIPHLDELEELTDRMLSHSIPWPLLFQMDMTITQLDIFAEWYEKYYILKGPRKRQPEHYLIRKARDFVDSLG